MVSVNICEFSSFLPAQLFLPFFLLLLPNSSHPIFPSAELLGPLTRSPSRSSKGRPDGPTEGTEVPGRSPPLGGREEESMTPPPLSQVHEGPTGVLPGAEPAPEPQVRWVAGQRLSLSGAWAGIRTLAIQEAPPRARTASHGIKLRSREGFQVSESPGLAPARRLRVCDT